MNSPSKTALVTGGSSGVGGWIAGHLATHGYDIAVHYHAGEESAIEVRDAVRVVGRSAEILRADLTNEAGAIALRSAFDRSFHRLDLLVNAAGVYHQKGFLELTEEEWLLELNSTATAVYFTTRTFLDLLRGSCGRVINVGDGECTRAGARHLAPGYHVGKCGVWLLTCSFAKHEAPHGVAVNMLSPGLMENSQGLGSPDVVPAGRFGAREDVEAAVDALLASSSAFVTGSNVAVGGAWNL